MWANIAKRGALLPLALLLCQCDKVQAMLKPTPPGPTPYDFHLTLEFTPAAVAKMEAGRDNIVIYAFYYGHAKPEYMAKADDLHRIELGYREAYFSNKARHVVINSSAIDTRLLPQTTEGEPYVLVTVATQPPADDDSKSHNGPHLTFMPTSEAAPTSPPPDTPGQQVECRTYTGPVKLLQTTPHTLTCDIATP